MPLQTTKKEIALPFLYKSASVHVTNTWFLNPFQLWI